MNTREVHFSLVENMSSGFHWRKTGVLIIFIVKHFPMCKTKLGDLTDEALTAHIWTTRDMLQ